MERVGAAESYLGGGGSGCCSGDEGGASEGTLSQWSGAMILELGMCEQEGWEGRRLFWVQLWRVCAP